MKFWKALAMVVVVVIPGLVSGQVVRPPIPTPRDTIRVRNDTLRTRNDSLHARADSLRAKADTIARGDTALKANFAAPDSVMQRLLNKQGYSSSRYQSEMITFDALTQAFQLTKNSLLQRGDSTYVKSDTIRYAGSGDSISVGSSRDKRSNVFVSGAGAPVLSSGHATYDLARKRASVSNVKTTVVESGQTLTITGERVVVVDVSDPSSTDTTKKNDKNYYASSGTFTFCPDSIPDYYFKAKELKKVGSFVVARPAILYIGDVPVLWLPFVFQDAHTGRHSGLIAPNIGVSDFIRNSKSYRRNIEGLGYYFALSDYMDAQASLDWRSGAGQSQFSDPGFMRYNGEFRYHWLDRFVTGNLALGHTLQAGSTNDALTWGHQQSFSRNSSFTMNLNLVKNTQLQRNTATNPYAAISTIASQANYQQKIGTVQLSLGGSQKQYVGRTQVDRNFPTMSLTTTPINIASWLSWTPSFNYSGTQNLHIDQPSSLGLLLRTGQTVAGIDTIFGDTLRRNSRTSQMTFDTPFTIFGNVIGNQFSVSTANNDFPERAIVTDVLTGVETTRIYAQTYHTELNWNPVFTLPPFIRNKYNLTPSLGFANVDGGAFAIRNERTGGKWVYQSKRPTFGVSASPTLFGVFSGFGPFQRFRHSISPTVSYSYAPHADVSNEYLAAVGRTKFSKISNNTDGYLGALAQNSLTFGLNTNIEAKLRSRNDSSPETGDKIKLLSVDFSSLSYDFERARHTGDALRGLTSQNFGYTVRSDLLPGFDVGVDYSLFQGSTLSDSAKFSPYRERVTAAFQFSNTANPFAVFTRLFSKAEPPSAASTDRNRPPPDDRYARAVASQPVAGSGSRSSAFIPTPSAGWQASLTFTSTRQRPVTGSNVVQYDPTAQCAVLNTAILRLQYEQCVAAARTNPTPQTPITSGIVGSPIYLTPPTTSLGSNLNFSLTEHWTAGWQTQYDFVQHDFASQIVSLQRDLHDWRAIFAFTKSPNGSFAFNFLIALKAEPDLKFDYRKATYRNDGLTTATP